ncbi:rRNA biogenesis protein RRP36 [Spatholobus suberectus]|nr:rRNA biogenesis protein RRP36 [Spatholobus suberectus]
MPAMDLFQNPSSLKSNRFETAMWAVKLVLVSMGIISTLVLLKVAIVPFTFHLLLSTLPQFWVSVRSWLTLPFLYIIVNFIIITIAASSNFQPKSNDPKPFSDSPARSDPKHTATITPTVSDTVSHLTEPENQTNEPKEEEKELEEEEEQHEEHDEEEREAEESGLFRDKFIIHPSLENCTNDYVLPDSDDKGDDTLDATWRAIQGKTMRPQLKKSDTWGASIAKAEPFQRNGEGGDDDPVAWAQKELKKSDTFNDRASLRREKSMSPEELYRRTEAFIKDFKNQMKLQRLESYQRLKEWYVVVFFTSHSENLAK